MPVSETIYAYAIGRIRVLETRLLDKNKLERMVEAPLVEEALKVLAETDYAGAVAELDSVYDFEKMLQEEIRHTYLLIRLLNPEVYYTDLITLRYDIHNLKVLFKAKYLGVSGDTLLFPVGTISLNKLRSIVADEVFRELPATLRTAVEQIAEDFAVSGDPQVIDISLDRALYAMLISSARELHSTFLEGLFIREADLTNIKTFLRVKRMGHDKEFLKKVLLPNGSLPADLFVTLLDEPLEFLSDRLSMSDYAMVVSEGVREWQEKGTITHFEKMADDLITAYLQRGKRKAFGLEPLVAYLYAKEIEVKNIRMILVAKINGLPIELIRERLRNAYV